MTSPPWLSVLVPTYNGAAHLRAALDSVAAQAGDDVEVVAVDDGSTDSTVRLLESYRDRLDLTVLADRHVGNWVANTNRALERARGRYATILHQDDLWLPGRLAALRRVRHLEPVLVVHASRFVDARGRRRNRLRVPVRPGLVETEDMLGCLLVQNFLSVPSVAFDRAAALDAGGLREELWFTADWDLWLALAGRGRTCCVPGALAGYRVHRQALTMTGSGDLAGFREQLELVRARHRDLGLRLGRRWPGVDRAARLSVEVNVALAGLAHRQAPDWRRLLAVAVRLRPGDWWRYLHASRIGERVLARLGTLSPGD